MLLLIHTIPTLVEVFTTYSHEILPNVEILHVLDQPLLRCIQLQGKIEKKDLNRLVDHINFAEAAGAKVGLITCSTLSPALETLKNEIQLPVYQIDDAMAKKAVLTGKRIGLLATAQSTIEPSYKNLIEQAKIFGKEVVIQSVFIKEALALLNSGLPAAHDNKLMESIRQITPNVDVIVLAQASMARICDSELTSNWQIPILSSPRIVLEQIKENHFK